MERFADHSDVKVALVWAGLGALSAIGLLPYLVSLKLAQPRLPVPLLAAIQGAQAAVLLFGMSWLGSAAGRSCGLGSPIVMSWVKRECPPLSLWAVVTAGLAGLLAGGFMVSLDRLYLVSRLPPTIQPLDLRTSRWEGLLASFYGGICEEIQFRLFLMSSIVWCARNAMLSAFGTSSTAAYSIAILLSAIFFAAAHLPSAAKVWPLNRVVVSRVMILNAVPGTVFGFVYWKLGFEYSVLAHFVLGIVVHVIRIC